MAFYRSTTCKAIVIISSADSSVLFLFGAFRALLLIIALCTT